MSQQRRLFFALWPDDGVRRSIQAAPFPRLKSHTTPMENWHVTLVFLGPTTVAQQLVCERVAEEIRADRFELKLDITGKFIRAKVAWLGCSRPPPELVRLQAGLESSLRSACPEHAAFAAQPRPYCPHLTLYRKVGNPLVPEKIKPVRWAVDSFSLVESRPAERPVYRIINSWKLGQAKLNGRPHARGDTPNNVLQATSCRDLESAFLLGSNQVVHAAKVYIAEAHGGLYPDIHHRHQ